MGSDTTKVIPPPRRGPRWIDLGLAAVAGSLATVIVLFALFFGRGVIGGATSGSPSPTASTSASASFSALPSISLTVAPRTNAPATSTPEPQTSAPAATTPPPPPPTTAAPTPRPTAPPPTKTP